MRHLKIVALAAVAVLAAAPARAQQVEGDTALMRTGRTYTQWFYEGKTDTLFSLLTPGMRERVGSAEGLAGFRGSVVGRMGAETGVVSETVSEQNGLTTYTRIAQFANAPAPVQIRWATDAEGRIAGFVVRPQRDPAPAAGAAAQPSGTR